MSFKIIAFKTGTRLTKAQLKENPIAKSEPYKVLRENKIYPFYSQFEFPNKDLSRIIYKDETNIDLYSFNKDSHEIQININAIVGSNGSGKSTLIELLYWANYNIGCKLDLLKNEHGRSIRTLQRLDLEIVYCTEGTKFIKLNFKNGDITKQTGWLRKNEESEETSGEKAREVIFNENSTELIDTHELSDFFYTIAINYSHYALNSEETGDWINHLFHKNDGYQTPIVLNPMRTRGNIDINTEKHLLNRRLLANILEHVGENKNLKDSLRNIVNDKIATELRIQFEIPFNKYINEHKPSQAIRPIRAAIERHFGFTISDDALDYDYYTIISLNYIHDKLLKIAKRYKPYFKYLDGDTIKNIDNLFLEIKNSNSHIIFKVKGVILYLKYREKIFGGKSNFYEAPTTLNIDTLSNTIRDINNLEPFWVNTFMMVPPAFFRIEIIPEDGSSFESLSSGEKQKIHSISSIVYHLINLNSVEQIKEKSGIAYLSYKYVNIVLDEIELYYHPDWQRTYIADLLGYIKKISSQNLHNIRGLNITFLTHSPFILSDIPSSSILFLEENGEPRLDTSDFKSFGANIHDLLKHTFFLRSGSMGEFAKLKINKTISFLLELKELSKRKATQRKNAIGSPEDLQISEIVELRVLKQHQNLIDIIDEPILKRKLSELFIEATGRSSELDIVRQRIAELQAYEAKLNKEI